MLIVYSCPHEENRNKSFSRKVQIHVSTYAFGMYNIYDEFVLSVFLGACLIGPRHLRLYSYAYDAKTYLYPFTTILGN